MSKHWARSTQKPPNGNWICPLPLAIERVSQRKHTSSDFLIEICSKNEICLEFSSVTNVNTSHAVCVLMRLEIKMYRKRRDRAKQQKKTTEANEGKWNENGYRNHRRWEKNVEKRWTTALHTQRGSTGKSWFWIVECFVRSVVYLCAHFKVRAMRNEQRMFVRFCR